MLIFTSKCSNLPNCVIMKDNLNDAYLIIYVLVEQHLSITVRIWRMCYLTPKMMLSLQTIFTGRIWRVWGGNWTGYLIWPQRGCFLYKLYLPEAEWGKIRTSIHPVCILITIFTVGLQYNKTKINALQKN